MTAAERAYTYAKGRILDGRLPGGTLITEGDVGADVGVSRTPVREAFLRLESEGLLTLYPKRGAIVVAVSAAEVESVMETRLLVERFAIHKIIEDELGLGAAPADVIARQEELAARENWREFVEADREFHRIFVAAADNPILLQLHDSLRDRQTRMNLAALVRNTGRDRQVLAEHRRWADAVDDRDLDGALDMVDEHLGATLALLRNGPARHDDR
jgi:DNA-binding GntR family transcriptional regulator